MKILLTNDDGIHAKGINCLFDALSQQHTVYMFAPHAEKSACSNALTIRHQVRVDFESERKFAVHGFPADCINIGVHSNLAPEVDIVVSGINHGPNLGDDIHYSGTVAGARSGFIFGKHSIAISLNAWGDTHYIEDCAEYLCHYIDNNVFFKLDIPTLVNINYPSLPKNDIKGTKVTSLGRRHYKDNYVEVEKSESHICYMLEGTVESADIEHTDVKEIQNGFITITPLTLDSTDYTLYKKFSNE